MNGAPVNLSPQEYRLVRYLMHNAGRVVTQLELTEHLYAQDFERESNAIEVLVGRVRRKLGVDVIETRRGFGYVINLPGTERHEAVPQLGPSPALRGVARAPSPLALVVAGAGLALLFQSHVERRLRSEMNNHIRQLASNLIFRPDGSPGAVPVSRPIRASISQLSGLYWQIEEEGGKALLRSRSLWDAALTLPVDKLPPGQVHSHEIKGPMMADLLVHEEPVVFKTPTANASCAWRSPWTAPTCARPPMCSSKS